MIIYLFDFFRVIAETSTGCLLAGSALGKRGMSELGFMSELFSCPNYFEVL